MFSLNPINPDASRHFCTSTREIFTQIFDIKAIDNDVFEMFPNCEKTDRGNATRRFKIKYFLSKKGLEFENVDEFVEKDIDNILELFHTLSTGTHGETKQFIYLDSLYDYVDGELQIGENQNIEKLEWIPIENLKDYDIVPPSVILYKKIGYM